MGGICLKEKKESKSAADTIPKPDHGRKYKGRKPQDDSWIEGGRRELPAPIARFNPHQDDLPEKKECGVIVEYDMADPVHPVERNDPETNDHRESGRKSLSNEKDQRSSWREIKINDVRNNLKETVKMR